MNLACLILNGITRGGLEACGMCADLQCVKSHRESVKLSSGWLKNPLKLSRLLGRVFARSEKAEHFENCSELFFKKKASFGRFFWWYIEGVFLRKEKRASLLLRTPSGEKLFSLCERSLLLCSLDYCIDECGLLLAGAVQVSQMAADGVSMCGGCARHQFALSFEGYGLM